MNFIYLQYIDCLGDILSRHLKNCHCTKLVNTSNHSFTIQTLLFIFHLISYSVLIWHLVCFPFSTNSADESRDNLHNLNFKCEERDLIRSSNCGASTLQTYIYEPVDVYNISRDVCVLCQILLLMVNREGFAWMALACGSGGREKSLNHFRISLCLPFWGRGALRGPFAFSRAFPKLKSGS